MEFPENVVDLLTNILPEYLGDYEYLNRPLRLNDPKRSIGIVATNWSPETNSMIIGQTEEQVQHHQIRIQLLVKHSDYEKGITIGGRDSTVLRRVLYRSPALRVGLAGLAPAPILNTVERYQQARIAGQSFLRNEMNGNLIYMSVTDYRITTEVTQL